MSLHACVALKVGCVPDIDNNDWNDERRGDARILTTSLEQSAHLGSLRPALPCPHGTTAKSDMRPCLQMEEKRAMRLAGLAEERKQAAAAEAARLAAEKA